MIREVEYHQYRVGGNTPEHALNSINEEYNPQKANFWKIMKHGI